ncbi:hypothetical protein F2Q68_00001242 [Brassica cretica]|uniref:Uncharacterized protein n=2 Tax=Brassica cretica TaxID=69181 RepID=A0ABQ7C9I4_BRACR|nr:hypothetical protein F2Q68_00001242 [Brassica cretica]KAF3547933.1 hypothetical protein DY000_02001656 [Brassica cretica]
MQGRSWPRPLLRNAPPLSSLSHRRKFVLALPPAWTARGGAYQRPEGSPSSIVLLALLPPLHQVSCLRYARSRGLGFGAGECSAAEALLLQWSIRLSVALATSLRLRVGGSRCFSGSMAVHRFRSRKSFGSGSSFGALVVPSSSGSLPIAWCVPVDPSTTAAGCGFEHAVGLVL